MAMSLVALGEDARSANGDGAEATVIRTIPFADTLSTTAATNGGEG